MKLHLLYTEGAFAPPLSVTQVPQMVAGLSHSIEKQDENRPEAGNAEKILPYKSGSVGGRRPTSMADKFVGYFDDTETSNDDLATNKGALPTNVGKPEDVETDEIGEEEPRLPAQMHKPDMISIRNARY